MGGYTQPAAFAEWSFTDITVDYEHPSISFTVADAEMSGYGVKTAVIDDAILLGGDAAIGGNIAL